jgi:anaerobic selenocysteine-containing dehydrogenase
MTKRIATEDGKIHLAINEFMDHLTELPREIKNVDGELMLIGRRHIRSNNSWMHNVQRLVKGKPHWQLFMHPQDMQSRNIQDGQQVSISSRTGEVSTVVKGTEDIMPGVVSLPHGWGHQRAGVKAKIAVQQQGVSVNDLTDEKRLDRISGNAALNGVPVDVKPL